MRDRWGLSEGYYRADSKELTWHAAVHTVHLKGDD